MSSTIQANKARVQILGDIQIKSNICACKILSIVLSVFIVILIRGGVPRYRYDFLTKLGWVKFLLYILLLFILALVMVFL